MRRIIAAAVILLFVVGVSICGGFIINKNADEIEKQISEIQKTAFTDTNGKAEKFFCFWEEKREIMSIFVNHEVIDEIGKVAAKMVSAERAKNSDDLFEAANEILYIIRGIREDEKFSLYTLL